MKRRAPYILWDWNGTLLDDTSAGLEAFNVQLRKRSLPPIDRAFYRAHFAFPVKPFYSLCGIALEHEDWDVLAAEYHAAYADQPKALNAETFAALDYAKSQGARQSIISALRQDLLDDITIRLGVAPYMEFVYGVDNLDGSSKLSRARELVATLRKSDPDGDFVLIGDALHDKEVADALGVRCVLCAQGSHSAERLRAVAPTGETLLDAIHLAFSAEAANLV